MSSEDKIANVASNLAIPTTAALAVSWNVVTGTATVAATTAALPYAIGAIGIVGGCYVVGEYFKSRK